MATVSIHLPGNIHCEEPAPTTFDQLTQQADRVRASDPSSPIRTSGHPPTSAAEAEHPRGMDIARTIATHYGHLPTSLEYQELLFGPVVTKADKKLRSAKFAKIQKDIFSELWGQGSYIQAFIQGVMSTENCRVLVTMWELKAQICDMVPAYQETAAEALTRQANSKAYRDGVADLQEMIKVTYQQAYNLASEKANTARGAEQILNQRRRDLFARKLVEIPTPEIQSGALQSVAQIEAAMPVPLFFRDVETRRDFWRSKWSKDVLVSQYAPRAAVDVRRLAEDGNPAQGQREYNTMTGNRFAVGADYLHTLFFAYRNFHAQLQPNIMDVQIRATAAQVNMNRRDDVYNLIRDMHSALGFESDDSYGPWVDAPVRVVQGFEVLSLNHQGLP